MIVWMAIRKSGPGRPWQDQIDLITPNLVGVTWYICSNIGLGEAEIMAKDLPTYINGYHLDITGQSLAMLMKS